MYGTMTTVSNARRKDNERKYRVFTPYSYCQLENISKMAASMPPSKAIEFDFEMSVNVNVQGNMEHFL